MLQSEFENLTGIFPDVLLYEAAEHEYNTGDWESKAEFCNAYKFNEDGLAEKIQRIANNRWFRTEEKMHPELIEDRNMESAMMQVQRRMLNEEFGCEDVGIAAIAFDYLLKELEGISDD